MTDPNFESLSFTQKIRRFSVSEGVVIARPRHSTIGEMDVAKAERDVGYELLKEDCNDILQELARSEPDKDKLKVMQLSIEAQLVKFSKIQQKYREQLIKSDQMDLFKQEKAVEKELCKLKIEIDIQCKRHLIERRDSSSSSGASGLSPEAYRLNLPKRELVKFDGDVRKWLAFWASFSEINGDVNIPDIEKFTYLVQSMTEDSPAYHHVTSFHLQAGNYKKAVESLTDRYGRPNMLIKVYVRDMLNMVIENSTRKGHDFTELVTKITHQLRNLESLGVTTDKCAQILYPVVESCLPDDVLKAWQRSSTYEEDLDKLLNFLQSEVNNKMERALAQSQFGTKSKKTAEVAPNNTNTSGKKKTATAASLLTGRGPKPLDKCVFCEGTHSTTLCRKAMDMSPQERIDIVKKAGHCLKCLKKGHNKNQCKKTVKCIFCKQDHDIIMCDVIKPLPGAEPRPSNSQAAAAEEEPDTPEASNSRGSSKKGASVLSLANQVRSPDVPLQILPVIAHGKDGKKVKVRAVVDPGSQRSYLTSLLADELSLPKKGQETIVNDLFGGRQTEEVVTPILQLMISDLNGDNLTTFNASAVDVILRSTPPTAKGTWTTDFLKRGIQFDDVNSSSTNIHILIGNDIAAKVYTGKIAHLSYGPSAMQTLYGWVLCGKLPTSSKSTGAYLVSTLIARDRPISDLWALDTLGIQDSTTRDSREELERNALKHFNDTVKVNAEGRYEIELPFFEGTQSTLPSNFYAAERRLRSTTASLKKQGLLSQYGSVFKEWEDAGMIETCEISSTISCHYLPHRAVVKPSSTTTPIRPVFDASARVGGTSLNECLEKGPNLLELIPAILTRFRMYQVGIVADIKKAFQQISVRPEHREYLRFLWWENESCTTLKCYRHTRVVFGVSSSPFLLGATLKYHLDQTAESKINLTTMLKDNLYVDNLVSSTSTLKAAHQIREESRELLLPGKFDLRGWEFGPSRDEKFIPVLGYIWETKPDHLKIDLTSALEKLDPKNDHLQLTQRKILSLCHSLFDPLGFIAPFVLLGKQLLRECHAAKLGWDKPVPQEIQTRFEHWYRQIPLISEVKINRHVNFDQNNSTVHVFCDASNTAAAAAAYLRVDTKRGVKVQLLMCKSRLAPVKVTIPRLELVACLFGARLAATLKDYLKNQEMSFAFWSDSTTAIAWISRSGPWGVFVQNRVNEIRNLTNPEDWRHIPGKQNPADIPSRGCSAKKLVGLRWWEGPEWLKTERYPSTNFNVDMEQVDAERKKVIVSALTKENPFLSQLSKIPSYNRMLRAVALWMRFIAKKFGRDGQQTPNPTSNVMLISLAEIRNAEGVILRLVQRNHVEALKKMRKLRPFEDETGLLRIKSRLTHEDSLDFISPILLPDNDTIVHMLIREEHERNSHAGVQYILSNLRERYWVVNGRKIVRKVIRSCATCRRFIATKLEVTEAPLPELRSGELIPFGVTGVDMAGPLFLSDGSKVWIALFTCANYRAVHLEIAESLSTDEFLKCLRRFVARRGRPHTILSDNGLNFTGASRFLKKINWEKIEEYASIQKINWIFNPPSAAWWGGFWERLIGMVKQILKRTLGNKCVKYVELLTLLAEIEEVMNNRPLTTMTEDPEDLIPLTPNMFIRNGGLSFLPEVDMKDAAHAKQTYKKIQRIREMLRSRFRLEYLGFLRQKLPAKRNQSLKPGDVVLVENELLKRLDWPIGIVLEALTGKDGKIRTYKIRTRSGVLIRPAQRLYPLEFSE